MFIGVVHVCERDVCVCVCVCVHECMVLWLLSGVFTRTWFFVLVRFVHFDDMCVLCYLFGFVCNNWVCVCKCVDIICCGHCVNSVLCLGLCVRLWVRLWVRL